MFSRDQAEAWIADRRDVLWDVVRIYLGLALFARGILFVMNPEILQAWLLQAGSFPFWRIVVGHYVVLMHLCGGLLLAVGLLTRIAAAVQLPILLGAVLFVHSSEGLLARGQSLELAGLVLFLLGVTTVVGSGRLSVDWLLARSGEHASDSSDTITEAIPGAAPHHGSSLSH